MPYEGSKPKQRHHQLTFAEIAKAWEAISGEKITPSRVQQICKDAEQKLAFNLLMIERGVDVQTDRDQKAYALDSGAFESVEDAEPAECEPASDVGRTPRGEGRRSAANAGKHRGQEHSVLAA